MPTATVGAELPKISGLEDEEVSTLLNVRTYRQYCQYVDDRLAGKCPFCDPLDPELNKVIQAAWKDGLGWRMWQNPFPIKHSTTHLIIAPVRHIVHPDSMESGDWDQMANLINYAISGRDGLGMGLPGGGVLMRWGDPKLNAGSIRHVHANIIVPDGTGEVRLPLAKEPAEVEEKTRVIAVFERMRCGVKLENLPYEEQKLVEGRMG
jgi:hypothetical protein